MENIQQYVKRLAKREDLSLKGLSERLGFSSRTTLDRALKPGSTPESVQRLAQSIQDCFDLPPDEVAALHTAALVSVHGEDKVRAMQQMWVFVQGPQEKPVEPLRVTDARDGRDLNLLERYDPREELHISVLNAQYVPGLFALLRQLLRRGNVTVDHFLSVNESNTRTVCSVCALMPIFYERGYNGYVRAGADLRETGLNDADMVLVERGASGQVDIIYLTGSSEGLLTEAPGPAHDLALRLGLDPECFTPFKRTYFSCTALEDYIRFSNDYAALERGRAIWKIKPDIGVDQIPTWILKQAMLGGCATGDEQLGQIFPTLCDIYARRYKDAYSKRKPTYTIFKRDAFRRFAVTGRTSDHFWAMRPYKPQERVAILQDMLDQQQNNPYVHFCFLKDDSMLRNVEIACYEGIGLLVLPSDTDYNLAEGHAEIMVTHPRMMDLFREFYMNILLHDCVYPGGETVRFLNELIRLAQSEMA